MSDRDRIRRPEPARTDPVRSASGVFRGGDGPGDGAPRAPGSAATNPFAWSGDDPVSRAVRAGCEVVDQAVRRGFGLGGSGNAGSAPPWLPPWMAARTGPLAGSWTTGQWVDAMTSAFTQWAQWFNALSGMARPAGGGGEPAWPGSPSSPSPSPAPSPSPSGAGGALRVTLELRAARAATVELDLPHVPPGTALEVHGLLAPATAAAPPITDVSLAITGGAVTVALGSIDQHPAGVYAGAVLAAGRACGTLTVRLV